MLTILLLGCAQYKVQTGKVRGYNQKVEKVFVWSALDTAKPLHYIYPSFDSTFQAEIKQAFENTGVVSDTRSFSPRDRSSTYFREAEQNFKPDVRLLIMPERISTYGQSITGLWINLSLMETDTDRNIWSGSLMVDPALDMTAWSSAGAKKLADQIVEAIKKDDLLLKSN